MAAINPYITFNGSCEEAFDFYKSVFGGDFAFKGRFNEMPADDKNPLPESETNKIMHVSLPIGGGTVLMGSDTMEGYGPPLVVGNNITISINADSKSEADKLYKALSEGGATNMPMADTFWGSYFGMLTDRYNINWMISYDEKKGG